MVQVKATRPLFNGEDFESMVFEKQQYANMFLEDLIPGTEWRYMGEKSWRISEAKHDN